MDKSRYLPPQETPRVTPRAASLQDELSLERDVHEQHLAEQYDANEGSYEPDPLVAPPARPGYIQRWVRVLIDGRQDVNASRASLDGWRPRITDIPVSYTPYDFSLGEKGDPKPYLQVGDLVLHEKLLTLHHKRDQYFTKKARKLEEVIDSELHNTAIPGHPIHQDRSTKIFTGSRDKLNLAEGSNPRTDMGELAGRLLDSRDASEADS